MRLGRRLDTGVAEHPPAPQPAPAEQPGPAVEAHEAARSAEPVPVELGAER